MVIFGVGMVYVIFVFLCLVVYVLVYLGLEDIDGDGLLFDGVNGVVGYMVEDFDCLLLFSSYDDVVCECLFVSL